MKNLLRCTLSALLLSLATPTLSTLYAAPPEDVFELYTVQEGESAAQLAARFLGHAEAAPELLQFNAISNPNEVQAGRILAIPHGARDLALHRLAEADEAFERARAAAADRFATNLFHLAGTLRTAAHKNRQRAVYDQAAAQAAVVEKIAALAVAEADRTAPVADQARITAVSGPVQWSAPGAKNWQAADAGTELAVGARVKTGPNGRADLTLADGSALQLQADSEFELAELTRDRRDQKRTSRLQVQVGEMLGRITPRENTNSQFHILSNGSVTAIRGTELRVGSDEARAVRVAVLEGEVALNSAGQKITLPENFGSVVPFNQPPAPPVKLLPAPRPGGPESLTTAVQRVALAWTPTDPIAKPAAYRVEIATDPAFTRIVQDQRVSRESWTSDTLAPGEYLWRVSSLDANQLQGPSTEARALAILRNLALTIQPSLDPVDKAGAKVVSPLYAFAAVPDRDSSVVDVEYSLDGGPYQPLTQPLSLNEAGPRTLRARGVGVDGEVGAEAELAVLVDAAAPEIGISVSPHRAHPKLVKAFTVTLSASDDTGVAALEYQLNDKPFTAYQGPIEMGAHSTYTLAFRAADTVGNVSETRTVNFPAEPAPRGTLPER